MRTRCRSFLTVAAALLSLPVCAQAPPAAGSVEAALQRFASADGGKMRDAALQALAVFDEPRVTEVLLAELQRAGTPAAAERALLAIGLRPRADVLPALQDYLQQQKTTPPLRAAAARTIARQGNRGIDLLLDLARADGDQVDDDVRRAAMAGLASAGDERAWRGLAPLALRGPTPQRLAVLRLLLPARGVAAVTQARLRLLQDSDAVLAATAWRQLAAEGHARTASAFEDLVERLGPNPAPAARAELVLGLGHGLPADAYAHFLRLAADDAPAVQSALRMVAGALGADAAFVRWLLDTVAGAVVPQERRVALAIVAKAPPASLQPVLDKVKSGLERPTPESLELALAMQDLLAKDAHWPEDVKQLLQASDAAVRTAGFALLLDLGTGDSIGLAQRSVAAKEWQLRSVAYRYLTRFRELASIPILIARVEKEQGRLESELADALFVHTGTRCHRRAEWEAWWRKHEGDHQLPAWETVRAVAEKRAAGNGSGGGNTAATYYGLPLTSRRAVFLIDVSGSMLQKVGTDGRHTRLDEAKRQLRRTVEQLPEDQWFNVIAYEGTLIPVWDSLHKATAGDKQHVLDLIDRTGAGRGGTNIHDALELAFQDQEVDTIYLLSDGEPTVGKIIEPDAIADQVRRWNYTRQVVVHGIAVGGESPLLRRLAAESGGQYVSVR